MPAKANGHHVDQQPVKGTEAGSGNASNPEPRNRDMEPDNNNQLLDEKAEKYLREVASIEDYPDAQDEQEAEKEIEKDRRDKGESK